jgi:RNA polymerase sigma-70 factor (ECF subfamily)
MNQYVLSETVLHNEKELLRRIAAGNETAFREVYDFYRITVYSFAHSLSHTDVMAEEITQEVFMKVWEKRKQLTEIDYFSTWIRTIAKNAMYSFFRRVSVEKRILTQMSQDEIEDAAPQDNLEYREMEQQIRSVLDQLTPQQRTIYRLSREESKSYAEIAILLNISHHTVKYHLSNIYRQLHSKISLVLFFLLLLKK